MPAWSTGQTRPTRTFRGYGFETSARPRRPWVCRLSARVSRLPNRHATLQPSRLATPPTVLRIRLEATLELWSFITRYDPRALVTESDECSRLKSEEPAWNARAAFPKPIFSNRR
ncbi:protein of unknown function [Hyphomicrobium sp. 1Nfss2.1]